MGPGTQQPFSKSAGGLLVPARFTNAVEYRWLERSERRLRGRLVVGLDLPTLYESLRPVETPRKLAPRERRRAAGTERALRYAMG